jgi:hypothetical protein
MSPLALTMGVSPDNQDVVYTPGNVGSRPGWQKVFGVALPPGGPNSLVPTTVYGKSYLTPAGGILNLYFDSNGILWREDVIASSGTYTQLAVSTPGSYCKSVTAFGREFIAISDGLHGTEAALQYDGTNLDRVTQDGPGLAPVATAFSLPAVPMLASAAVTALPVTEADPAGGLGGTFAQINFWTPNSVANVFIGSLVTIAGNSSPAMNVTNAPVIAIYTGGAGAYANLIVLAAITPAGTTFGLGGTASITSGQTAVRANGVVTVTTSAAHQLRVGYQAQITGLPASAVGGTIASIVINNEDSPDGAARIGSGHSGLFECSCFDYGGNHDHYGCARRPGRHGNHIDAALARPGKPRHALRSNRCDIQQHCAGDERHFHDSIHVYAGRCRCGFDRWHRETQLADPEHRHSDIFRGLERSDDDEFPDRNRLFGRFMGRGRHGHLRLERNFLRFRRK